MSEHDREGFDEDEPGASELPPVPPAFEDAVSELATPPPPAGPAAPTAEERNWAMGSHLAAFSTFLVPIPGMSILGPLIVWLMKKDTMPYVDYHGKEALNFQISFAIWGILAVIAGLLMFVVGILITVPLVALVWFVYTIVGAVKASNDEYYQYPFTIRFVK